MSQASSLRSGMLNRKLGKVFSLDDLCTLGNSNISYNSSLQFWICSRVKALFETECLIWSVYIYSLKNNFYQLIWTHKKIWCSSIQNKLSLHCAIIFKDEKEYLMLIWTVWSCSISNFCGISDFTTIANFYTNHIHG